VHLEHSPTAEPDPDSGYNEGTGIWGVWEVPPTARGGFHIWPAGMADPTQQTLDTHVESAARTPVSIGGPGPRVNAPATQK
jgi:hypothetical protein